MKPVVSHRLGSVIISKQRNEIEMARFEPIECSSTNSLFMVTAVRDTRLWNGLTYIHDNA